uniref:Uncharacterized protein n=1 Tax=Podoviridae sp. ctV3c15 TaxID=2826559 RepID=A0A8S5MSC3_9CAUD|nr:MAG TPA: hypothetical protein [Podoviridae sp. ctV3c15]
MILAYRQNITKGDYINIYGAKKNRRKNWEFLL